MPVALARPVARRQAHEIDPKVREPAGVAQPLPHAGGTGRIERRRIARALALRHGGNVDLGHGSAPRGFNGLGLPHESSAAIFLAWPCRRTSQIVMLARIDTASATHSASGAP